MSRVLTYLPATGLTAIDELDTGERGEPEPAGLTLAAWIRAIPKTDGAGPERTRPTDTR
ncbi:hypothetical protein [Cryptosporangium aurantiacum]|uniref:Uncharacterized protein n=1 Tax=Cryptosporangium aurantiacum TaxID=134849 RepID=A0A1M7R9M8_9ACTN|nr:hypothetical protein [Cryptosporangium aurantiacum]SHN43045.1 hypothetical protein SAMN05443668_1094 [Cryptosporangium aurantiacum]